MLMFEVRNILCMAPLNHRRSHLHQEKIQVSPLGDSQCWLPPDPPGPPDLQEGSKHSAPTLQGGSDVVTCPQGGQGGQGGETMSLPQEGNAYFFLMSAPGMPPISPLTLLLSRLN